MSDQSQGPGWWLASDGRWYSPDQHPDAAHRARFAPPPPGPAFPHALPPGPPAAAPTNGQQTPWWRRWWAIAIGVFLVLGAIGSALGGSEDDDPKVSASATTEATTGATAKATVTTRKATTTTVAKTTTTDPFANETPAQHSARRKAADYLDLSGFSRSGLIKQLEFEGFSTADATYGADAQQADWNEQAARKAKAYLDMTGFSRAGLIQQLKFEGFSQSEAEFGASSVGL